MSNVKGIPFLGAEQTKIYEYCLLIMRDIASAMGFQRVTLPMLAEKHLFEQNIGSSSIVQKQMFELKSQGRESLVLRPEGTAILVDALIQNHTLRLGEIKRYYYEGPMFRYERPQRGRLRQFYQFGIESFNITPLLQDMECISFSWEVIKKLGLEHVVQLEINDLGSSEEMQAYISHLLDFLKTCKLDDAQLQTMQLNPLRCLDTQDAELLSQLVHAPKINEYVQQAHLHSVLSHCRDQGMPVVINPFLVRGLDYYSHTVFEWKVITSDLGAQSTICAGGRYDQMLSSICSPPPSAMGCAFGIDRLVLLHHLFALPSEKRNYKIYLFALEEKDLLSAFRVKQQYPQSIHFDAKLRTIKSHLRSNRHTKLVLYCSQDALYDARSGDLFDLSSCVDLDG